jgi:hypothetical protein
MARRRLHCCIGSEEPASPGPSRSPVRSPSRDRGPDLFPIPRRDAHRPSPTRLPNAPQIPRRIRLARRTPSPRRPRSRTRRHPHRRSPSGRNRFLRSRTRTRLRRSEPSLEGRTLRSTDAGGGTAEKKEFTHADDEAGSSGNDSAISRQGPTNLREGTRQRREGIRRGRARTQDRALRAETLLREGRRSLGAEEGEGPLRSTGSFSFEERTNARQELWRRRRVRPFEGGALRTGEEARGSGTLVHVEGGARRRNRAETTMTGSHRVRRQLDHGSYGTCEARRERSAGISFAWGRRRDSAFTTRRAPSGRRERGAEARS